jgi:hypothetical protein
MEAPSEQMTVDAPQGAVDPPRCWTCGAPLAPSRTRPRETCSPGCQRRRGFALRKIARRRVWMREWQVYAARGHVSSFEAAEGIADLAADIEAFETPLWAAKVEGENA